MARPSLYSPSPQRPATLAQGAAATSGQADAAGRLASATGAAAPAGIPPDMPPDMPPDIPPTLRRRLASRLHRHRHGLAAVAVLALVSAAGWPGWTARVQRPLTLAQIDSALRDSIAKEPLAGAGVAAYEAILPSVVRVEGESAADDGPPDKASGKAAGKPADKAHPPPTDGQRGQHGRHGGNAEDGHSVGSGVVIVDKGLILTSLHVVDGAARLTVTFADGSQSEAFVVNRQPENDLAVLQAKTIPDDLHVATLRSTAGLSPGEPVLAVGFPFGIGPSASLGVVSGLKREFRSPEGQRILTNLIQFDAAANPGNSGGPLVTMDGHVVGIVAAIMNPNQQRTFIGIGFAVPIEAAAAGAGMPPF